MVTRLRIRLDLRLLNQFHFLEYILWKQFKGECANWGHNEKNRMENRNNFKTNTSYTWDNWKFVVICYYEKRSMKKVSTCFYMAILALADTGNFPLGIFTTLEIRIWVFAFWLCHLLWFSLPFNTKQGECFLVFLLSCKMKD